MTINRHNFIHGLRDGIPIALGYLAVSFALGIKAQQIGMSPLTASLMSLLNLTSAGEAGGLDLLAVGTTWLEIALTQFVINIRYMLMSCSLSQKFSGKMPFYHRLLVGYGVTDEIFGISSVREEWTPAYTYGALAVAVPGWTLGTFLGVTFGNLLPASMVSALSVALYGMFLAIVLPPARRNWVLALLVVVSMASSWVLSVIPWVAENVSPGFRIVLLTVLISGAAAILFPIREEGEQNA